MLDEPSFAPGFAHCEFTKRIRIETCNVKYKSSQPSIHLSSCDLKSAICSTNVVRNLHFSSRGSKTATFENKSSTRAHSGSWSVESATFECESNTQSNTFLVPQTDTGVWCATPISWSLGEGVCVCVRACHVCGCGKQGH